MPTELSVLPIAQMTLADYTRRELILPALRERDAAGMISELSQLLQRHGCVSDMLPLYHTALNQELLSNSAQACGLAFPHARLSGVKHLQFAFGRAPEPVVWGPKGSHPVGLVFLLAVPATDAACYLHLLATLARLAQHPERLRQLRLAPDAAAISAVLEAIKLRP